jgi:BlaI family transcriptional regulator, penicillinase repressor
MVLKNQHSFSRRERQVMDVLIARGRASAVEIQSAIPEPPGYSAVRATLRIMEEKGHIRHEQQGASYVYLPKVAPARAKRSALRHILDTFFNGSPEQVMAALLDSKPSDEELGRIAVMIEAARQKGR